MTPIETLLQTRKLQMDEVTRLRNLGYQRRGVTQFQKSIMKRAFDAVDKTNIEIEKIEYNQGAVIKVLKDCGLTASKKQSTAIRGFNTYTRGYEVDNKYSVSYIALHNVSQDSVDALNILFKIDGLKAVATIQGITLNK
jgi:hypothetical protein